MDIVDFSLVFKDSLHAGDKRKLSQPGTLFTCRIALVNSVEPRPALFARASSNCVRVCARNDWSERIAQTQQWPCQEQGDAWHCRAGVQGTSGRVVAR